MRIASLLALGGSALAIVADVYVAAVVSRNIVTLFSCAIPTLLAYLMLKGTRSEIDSVRFIGMLSGAAFILGTLVLFYHVGFFYVPAAIAILLALVCWPRRPLDDWR